MSEMQRFRADIQGLRAIAVTSVVLYHAAPDALPGGFVGVDIFFVISGFLITRILLRELQTERYSIASFYVRRIRRLFPALYTMLAFTLVAGAAILPPGDLSELGKTSAATVLFASNLMLMKLTGYFGGAAELKPLLHTWSLAVEEQFYLAFPPLLALTWKYAERWLKPLLWASAVVSLLLCVALLKHHPTAAFYLPVTRAYELLIGSILAANALPTIKSERALDGLSVVGLILVGYPIFFFDHFTLFPGFSALLPCIGTALIILAGNERDSIAGRLISFRAAIFIGSLSYSWYLWHWPILCYLRWSTLGTADPELVFAAVAASLIAAYLSWRFIEQPALGGHPTSKKVFTLGAIAMVAAVAISAVPIVSKGFENRFSDREHALLAASNDSNQRRATCHSEDEREVRYNRSCVFGENVAPSAAVYGDSFGAELTVALGERFARSGRSIMEITSSACPPAIGYNPPARSRCSAYNAKTLKALVDDPRIGRVFLVANYEGYPKRDRDRMFAGLGGTLAALRSAGKAVTLIKPIPSLPFEAPSALALVAHRGGDIRSFGASAVQAKNDQLWANDRLEQLATRFGASTVSPFDALCDKLRCSAYKGGTGVLYFDSKHLSITGARYVTDKLSIE